MNKLFMLHSHFASNSANKPICKSLQETPTMALEVAWSAIEEKSRKSPTPFDERSGYDSKTGIYHSLEKLSAEHEIPTRLDLGTAGLVLSHFSHAGKVFDKKPAFIDASNGQTITYGELRSSVYSLASGLIHGLGVRKGDVVFVLSPNSILFPTICLAVVSVGAILTTANPLNTESEIAKQVRDSGAKLAISAPEELKKLAPTGVPIILTTRPSDGEMVSVEELIESCSDNNLPQVNITQSDTAAILYSSGTTGMSKGVVLTHANLISIMKLLVWSADVSSSLDDVFLGFIPMFHIYGLLFFAMGLLCMGVTSVIMKKFDFKAMLSAIENHKVNNLPAVPPVVLALVKYGTKAGFDLSSLRRVGTGAAPLSKELSEEFRRMFPWVELRQGYGLTETCGGATFFVSDKDSKARPASSGRLIPTFCAKVVDIETGKPLPPRKEGELWLKSPTIMKEYLGNVEATAATFDPEGWLKTGDLAFIDENGFVHVLERIKELIKHNGYQVAPAELESLLLSHADIVDAAVIPVEDLETGQIPMAYVVRAARSELTEDQVIQFVASQVAPYKKVRRVSFIDAIPRSAAGKILRKDLVSRSKLVSKL